MLQAGRSRVRFPMRSLDFLRLSLLDTSATIWPIVPAPNDNEFGAVGGMRIGRGNLSSRRKPAPVPLCPQKIPHDLGSNPGRCDGKQATA
jgi:hypothetical protein